MRLRARKAGPASPCRAREGEARAALRVGFRGRGVFGHGDPQPSGDFEVSDPPFWVVRVDGRSDAQHTVRPFRRLPAEDSKQARGSTEETTPLSGFRQAPAGASVPFDLRLKARSFEFRVKRFRRPPRVSRDLYRFASVGTQFAATLAVFGGIGWWLDERFGSTPWLLLCGVFLGFGLGLYSMVLKLSPDEARKPSNGDDNHPPK